jgi:hypothetical protein
MRMRAGVAPALSNEDRPKPSPITFRRSYGFSELISGNMFSLQTDHRWRIAIRAIASNIFPELEIRFSSSWPVYR